MCHRGDRDGLPHPSIDDLDRRNDVFRRTQDIEQANARPFQRLAEDEGKLSLSVSE